MELRTSKGSGGCGFTDALPMKLKLSATLAGYADDRGYQYLAAPLALIASTAAYSRDGSITDNWSYGPRWERPPNQPPMPPPVRAVPNKNFWENAPKVVLWPGAEWKARSEP